MGDPMNLSNFAAPLLLLAIFMGLASVVGDLDPKLRTTSRASSARCGRQAARAAESAADHGGESRGHHRTAAARLAGGERESVLTESGTFNCMGTRDGGGNPLAYYGYGDWRHRTKCYPNFCAHLHACAGHTASATLKSWRYFVSL